MTFLSIDNQLEPNEQQQLQQQGNELNTSSQFFGFQQPDEDSLMDCQNLQNTQAFDNNLLNQLQEKNIEQQSTLPSDYLEATLGFDNFQVDNFQDLRNQNNFYYHKQNQLFPCFQPQQFQVGFNNQNGLHKEDTKNLLNFTSQGYFQQPFVASQQPQFLPYPQQGKHQNQGRFIRNYPSNTSINIKIEATNSEEELKKHQHQSSADNNQTNQMQDILSQTYPKCSLNYYQIFLEFEKKQQQQQEQQQQHHDIQDIHTSQQSSISSLQQLPQCPPTEISSSSSLAVPKKETEDEQEDPESPSESTSTAQQQLKKETIHQANKKNVVKNIMSAFKNFILEPEAHGYDPSELHVVFELYNETKHISDNQLKEMIAKFKRYITSKNFNHYTVKLLIKHVNYSPVFKYFLSGPVSGWINRSKVADVHSHQIMVNFLLDCFEDISLIDLLKRHEKKRAHFN